MQFIDGFHHLMTNIYQYLKENEYICVAREKSLKMNKDINRIKVVLADKKRTNKWLAEQLGKDPGTVSKWCTNTMQPNLETLVEIAKCLEVEPMDLLRPINEQ